ncbi:MAG: ATP-binding cassette domain-containing protein [Akkermansiaceae bacterium]|nr:ATP-binding cassette domain-containing protein [Akkermansiaceae bacterium]
MLELKNIRKTFHKGRESVVAVDDVSLDIRAGEILGLVGESGCGKSTLSRIIMQLLPPDSGSVRLGDTDLTSLPRHQIRRHRLDFQMVFQDPYASLNPRLTVFSTLGEALQQRHPELKRGELRQRVGELLEMVGLSASASPSPARSRRNRASSSPTNRSRRSMSRSNRRSSTCCAACKASWASRCCSFPTTSPSSATSPTASP